LIGALKLVNQAGLPAIRAKSTLMTTRLSNDISSRLARFGVRVVTPTENARRGGHITLAHPAAGKLSRALRARGVIPDFRPPNLLRLAPAPLYTSFAECERAIGILEDILTTNAHEQLAESDGRVT
jgi:kynureninase